jgi:HSP20 family protein
MLKKKQSFFERLTGTQVFDEDEDDVYDKGDEDTEEYIEEEEEYIQSPQKSLKKQSINSQTVQNPSVFQKMKQPAPISDKTQNTWTQSFDTQKPESSKIEEEDIDFGIGELSVDLIEDSKNLIVQALVAGVHPEDIVIDVTRNTIKIEGSREVVRKDTEEHVVINELYWGEFTRTIELPHEVEPEQAIATARHGLLTITVPKIDKSRRASIKVKSE